MYKDKIFSSALKSAFPYTLPVLSGFVLLGITYGVLMNAVCEFKFTNKVAHDTMYRQKFNRRQCGVRGSY